MEKSKAQLAKEFKQANPEADAKQVAEASGMPIAYAQTWISKWKREQAGTKPRKYKKRKAKKVVIPIDKSKEAMMRQTIHAQGLKISQLEVQIANLHHQITGYEAVISFLEHKLEKL